MEVVVAPMMPMAEFNFDSACTSPYVSAPSSPRGFGSFYTSAPTSPSRAAAFYRHLRSSSFSVAGPFDWEPQSRREDADREGEDKEEEDGGEEQDFAFEFSGQLVMGEDDALTATADELFEAGKIRPLKPPPLRLQRGPGNGYSHANASAATSPRSPRSRVFWSPRHRKKPDGDCEPFVEAPEEAIRGRDRTVESVGGGGRGGSRRTTRSLSPLRIAPDLSGRKPAADVPAASYAKGGSSRKWRFKDLFLFRSASEGRVSGGKDPLRKYTALSPAVSRRVAADEEARNASFRSAAATEGSSRRGLSAHYAAKRAVSEEMRRRTFLPYRQGLLGCLAFNPAIDGLVKGLS